MDQKADHLADDGQTTTRTVMDDSMIEIIGTLIAAAARVIVARIRRHRGGPGVIQRLASALAALLIFVIRLMARQACRTARVVITPATNASLRYLVHPPAAWAAP